MASSAIERPSTRSMSVGLVLLLGLAILLNYVDRGAIAIAAPKLKPELGLTATQFGIAVSAFAWIYVPMQFVVGWMCDRWCVYRLMAAGIALWAVSTMAMGLVGGLGLLVVLRLGLGLGESITFPGATTIIARHVDPSNRGMAYSVVAAGIALGPVVGTFAGGMLVASAGWRTMFLLFGAITLLWVVPWLLTARRLPDFAPEVRDPPVPIGQVARKFAVWAMGIAHFCATYPLYFIIAWLPLYLVQSRGFSIPQMTYLATLGFIAQAVSALLLGWGSDAWTRSGRSEAFIRRAILCTGSAVEVVAVLGILFATSTAQIGGWLILFGAAAATSGSNLYAVAQMFAGPRSTGSFIGIQNGIGNIPGIVMPIATGMIVDVTGVYDNAFYVTAAVCAVGALWAAYSIPAIRMLDFGESRFESAVSR